MGSGVRLTPSRVLTTWTASHTVRRFGVSHGFRPENGELTHLYALWLENIRSDVVQLGAGLNNRVAQGANTIDLDINPISRQHAELTVGHDAGSRHQHHTRWECVVAS